MKFRKKPVVIEAMQWHGSDKANLEKIKVWSNGAVHSAKPWKEYYDWLEIKTLEGVMEASPGDWIIKGIKGEFYPVKDEIFKETYEAVQE